MAELIERLSRSKLAVFPNSTFFIISGGGNTKRTHLAGVGAISVDKTYLLQEWITPLERRLYFTTAHAHFLAGCPALALEVLSKLPDHVQQPDFEADKNAEQTVDGGR